PRLTSTCCYSQAALTLGCFSFGSTAEHVDGCSPIGDIPSAAQFAATEPPTCGCAPVARFTRNSNATLSSCSCLSPARPPAPTSWSATLSATSRPPPGERDLTRYRPFPARPGSICCEPLEARSTTSKINTGTRAVARRRQIETGGNSRRQLKGRDPDGIP